MVLVSQSIDTDEEMSSKYKKTYVAEVDLVRHEHWVAVYEDDKKRKNIRIILGEDAWKFDIQVGMEVEVCSRPHNSCKIIRGVRRPH